jgi:replication factor C small subunit
MRLVEKYRPKNWEELLGQEEVVASLKKLVESKSKVHLLFVGPPGCGKTSAAYVFARAYFGEDWSRRIIEFNASDERGIDTIRTKIKRLASTKGERIILLDEADNLTQDAQQALRRIMERAVDTIFILTANQASDIIDPIKSRCSIFEFKRLPDEIVMRRLIEICKAEGIKISPDCKEAFIQFVKSVRGDLRMALNKLDGVKEITKEVLVTPPQIGAEALRTAVSGNFDAAKSLLETAYVQSRWSWESIIQQMYQAVDELNLSKEQKARLYTKIAEAESRCRLGSNPLLQLVSLLAWAYILPHFPEKCPLRYEG